MNHSEKGNAIAELCITISIMLALIAIVYPSYKEFKENKINNDLSKMSDPEMVEKFKEDQKSFLALDLNPNSYICTNKQYREAKSWYDSNEKEEIALIKFCYETIDDMADKYGDRIKSFYKRSSIKLYKFYQIDTPKVEEVEFVEDKNNLVCSDENKEELTTFFSSCVKNEGIGFTNLCREGLKTLKSIVCSSPSPSVLKTKVTKTNVTSTTIENN